MLVRVDHMKKMPFPKRRLFKLQKVDTESFTARQLVDTQYIARQTLHYLEQLGSDVVVCKGATTAALRRKWDLNSILAAPGEDCEKKNRMDHRHHSIDAVVAALTSRRLFQLLSRQAHKEPDGKGLNDKDFTVPLPWLGFRNDVESAVQEIVVSHQANRKIHGPLHKDMSYGYAGPGEKKGTIHLCKKVALQDIKKGQIKNIRDPYLKKKITELVENNNGNIKKAFSKEFYIISKKCKTIVKSVRVLEENISPDTVMKIENESSGYYKYHFTKSNHHVEILENVKTGKRKGVFVTMLEAAERARIDKKPVIQRDHGPEWKFVMALCVNDMVEVQVNGKPQYYRIQKMSGGQQRNVILRLHSAARSDVTKEFNHEYIQSKVHLLECNKINTDALGKVR